MHVMRETAEKPKEKRIPPIGSKKSVQKAAFKETLHFDQKGQIESELCLRESLFARFKSIEHACGRYLEDLESLP